MKGTLPQAHTFLGNLKHKSAPQMSTFRTRKKGNFERTFLKQVRIRI